jgi:hypothetical protein
LKQGSEALFREEIDNLKHILGLGLSLSLVWAARASLALAYTYQLINTNLKFNKTVKLKILAITGSQRINGNSYQLAKTVLNSTDCESSIIQLSKKKIDYCIVCGECV